MIKRFLAAIKFEPPAIGPWRNAPFLFDYLLGLGYQFGLIKWRVRKVPHPDEMRMCLSDPHIGCYGYHFTPESRFRAWYEEQVESARKLPSCP